LKKTCLDCLGSCGSGKSSGEPNFLYGEPTPIATPPPPALTSSTILLRELAIAPKKSLSEEATVAVVAVVPVVVVVVMLVVVADPENLRPSEVVISVGNRRWLSVPLDKTSLGRRRIHPPGVLLRWRKNSRTDARSTTERIGTRMETTSFFFPELRLSWGSLEEILVGDIGREGFVTVVGEEEEEEE